MSRCWATACAGAWAGGPRRCSWWWPSPWACRALVPHLGQWLAHCLPCGAQRGRGGIYFALQFLVSGDCTKGNNWPGLLMQAQIMAIAIAIALASAIAIAIALKSAPVFAVAGRGLRWP